MVRGAWTKVEVDRQYIWHPKHNKREREGKKRSERRGREWRAKGGILRGRERGGGGSVVPSFVNTHKGGGRISIGGCKSLTGGEREKLISKKKSKVLNISHTQL